MTDSFWPDRNIPRISPGSMDENRVTYFAETDARNKRRPFGIKAKDRTRHTYVIGKTGMGKSTLLENLAIQDIQNGEGLCFIDPHGKTADLLLDYVPQNRMKDVLYFAPFDVGHPISFNIMEDVGEDKRHLVVSGLMSAFKKLWGEESFSDRMQYILQNTLHALLEYPEATLLGVNRMYADKVFRDKVVANISDLSVKTYWTEEFAGYTERFAAEATPAIQNKIGQFTSNPLIRNVIGQPKSSFDLRKIMDDRKIMIVNLSKGRVGENNANLLGSMLITKLYLAAMSRADVENGETFPDFHLYVDEFQSFANESFADILSEARKYSLTLTVAHQYMAQMSEEVRDAVIGNVGSMIVFRIGGADAEMLEKEFGPTFTVEDMVNLGFAQIYLKLMIDGVSSPPFSATTLPPIVKHHDSYRSEIIDMSRAQFAQPRGEVEKAIVEWQAKQSQKEAGGDASRNKGDQKQDARRKHTPQPKNEVCSHEPKKEPKKDPGHRDQRDQTTSEKKNPFKEITVSPVGKLEVKKEMHKVETDASKKHLEQHASRDTHTDTKGPTPTRSAELKNVLSSLIATRGADLKGQKKEETKDKDGEKKADASPQKKSNTQFARKDGEQKDVNTVTESSDKGKHRDALPSEISKDELQSLLQVDEE